jgi:hypothetical protein
LPLLLDENGLQTQTQTEIKAELIALLLAKFGVNLNVTTESFFGQLSNILSEVRALDEQALLALYRSLDPNAAIGRALDARAALTGSLRQGATNSVVDGVLTFGSAGTMNNGDLIHNDDNDTLWELTDGPHTSAGPWPEDIAAQFTAVETGPISAQAGTTWSLVTAVSGLTGFTNPTDDAEVGRNQESDGDFRKRRLVELYAAGTGPLVAITARVSRVDGVLFARTYHNPDTLPVDSYGIPFKAFNVLVETNPPTPGADLQQAIFDAIWLAMGAGGQAFGTDFSGTSVDSEGTPQPVAFDTVDVVDIEIEIDLTTSTSEDPITPNLATIVRDEVAAAAQADLERVGRDVRALDIEGIVHDLLQAGTISGVDDVVVRMNISPGVATAVPKLSIGIRQKPDFDSGNITVTLV